MGTNYVLPGNIPMEEFLRAFPFYFAWDEHDTIIATGPSLTKICPLARVGARVQDIFRSQRPAGSFSFALAQKYYKRLFILEDRR